MDIGKAFGFVFEDERWVTKVLLGGLFFFIPIVNFAVLGYMLKIAENVAKGSSTPLPEWSDFGDLFMRGLYTIVIGVVYAIPVFVIYCLLLALVGGAGMASDQNNDAMAGGLGLVACFGYLVLFVVGILVAIVQFPAVARYVATGSLSEAFKFGEVIAAARAEIGTWIIVILVSILAGIVGGLGSIACGGGMLFTMAYAYMVQGHVLGQAIIKTGLLPSYSDAPTSYEPPTSYQ